MESTSNDGKNKFVLPQANKTPTNFITRLEFQNVNATKWF